MAKWVCWLGGEPTDQEDLVVFLSLVHANNLKNCLYTGRTFDSIEEDIKTHCDIIIDNPFIGLSVNEENTNQNIYVKINNNFKRLTWNELKELYIC